jgi:hypothetical protein
MSFLPGNFAIYPALLREYHILLNAAPSSTYNTNGPEDSPPYCHGPQMRATQVPSGICRELRDLPHFLPKRSKFLLGGPHLAGRDKFGNESETGAAGIIMSWPTRLFRPPINTAPDGERHVQVVPMRIIAFDRIDLPVASILLERPCSWVAGMARRAAIDGAGFTRSSI